MKPLLFCRRGERKAVRRKGAPPQALTRASSEAQFTENTMPLMPPTPPASSAPPSFATKWLLENQAGRPEYTATKRRESALQIEQVGRELRAMMPWLKKVE